MQEMYHGDSKLLEIPGERSPQDDNDHVMEKGQEEIHGANKQMVDLILQQIKEINAKAKQRAKELKEINEKSKQNAKKHDKNAVTDFSIDKQVELFFIELNKKNESYDVILDVFKKIDDFESDDKHVCSKTLIMILEKYLTVNSMSLLRNKVVEDFSTSVSENTMFEMTRQQGSFIPTVITSLVLAQVKQLESEKLIVNILGYFFGSVVNKLIDPVKPYLENRSFSPNGTMNEFGEKNRKLIESLGNYGIKYYKLCETFNRKHFIARELRECLSDVFVSILRFSKEDNSIITDNTVDIPFIKNGAVPKITAPYFLMFLNVIPNYFITKFVSSLGKYCYSQAGLDYFIPSYEVDIYVDRVKKFEKKIKFLWKNELPEEEKKQQIDNFISMVRLVLISMITTPVSKFTNAWAGKKGKEEVILGDILGCNPLTYYVVNALCGSHLGDKIVMSNFNYANFSAAFTSKSTEELTNIAEKELKNKWGFFKLVKKCYGAKNASDNEDSLEEENFSGEPPAPSGGGEFNSSESSQSEPSSSPVSTSKM